MRGISNTIVVTLLMQTLRPQDALHTVAFGLFTRLGLPEWILNLGLTQHHRLVTTAFAELESYMLEMIRERRTSGKVEERYDLFSSLLDANEEEEVGKRKLSDHELIGMYRLEARACLSMEVEFR